MVCHIYTLERRDVEGPNNSIRECVRERLEKDYKIIRERLEDPELLDSFFNVTILLLLYTSSDMNNLTMYSNSSFLNFID